jgi:hypothetical protein
LKINDIEVETKNEDKKLEKINKENKELKIDETEMIEYFYLEDPIIPKKYNSFKIY